VEEEGRRERKREEQRRGRGEVEVGVLGLELLCEFSGQQAVNKCV
jgi:hypothetical protein